MSLFDSFSLHSHLRTSFGPHSDLIRTSMASVEGTRRFVQRLVASGRLHPAWSSPGRRLGPLHCTPLGFGAYRLGADGLPSLKLAAELVNVFDTSSHYENESFLGPVLGESSLREEFILCTKVGHVRGEPPKGAVPIKGDDWHCIEPSFVEAEVRACKERLRTVPDIVFLHNPEYMLSARLKQQVPIADAWDEMYQALFQAFKALETLCSEGSISSGYGVSSNFLSCSFSVTGRPNLYESLVLDRVLDAASAAAGAQGLSQHRFQVAQLPLNLFESGAVLGRGAQMEGDCFMAERLGVSLLTNRPLNALPMPGVSAGDWGRSASHLQIREAKPMGAVPSLLKRVLKEVLGEGPLQQLALRVAASAPVACALNGARRPAYVEDLQAVLQAEPLTQTQVEKAMRAVRSMAEELGCDTRGLW
ncbi:unnamed protein product [Effrenium voratum]|uniref:NADP-dependent oxidoreductase domain-containing protein n=1 Tax=Effrenium voratum TaxID=2562239 RepID=A0AA36MKS6_9DINO|nr:unnamed protein product [Effrenium voratum]